MSENNSKGSGSTIDKLLSMGDADHKNNPDKQLEPESLLVPTKHNFVTSPWSRLGIIAVPFGVGFLAIFLILNGVFNPSPPEKIAQKPGETITATEQTQDSEGDGDARAKLALSDQEDELGRINKNKFDQPAPVPVSVNQKVVPSSPPSPRPAPRPVQNIQPRRVVQTTSQPIRTYTQPLTRTSFSPRPSMGTRAVAPLDPLEQLNKLRSIGSYGKIAYAETSTSKQSSLDPDLAQVVQNQPNEQTHTNNLDQTTPQNSSGSIEKIRPKWKAISKVNKITLANNYLPQESQILRGKQTRYLTVGSFATGVIVTPLVQTTVNSSGLGQTQTPTSNNTKSIARLQEDLRDNYGQVAIPSGTIFAVELASVDGGSYAIAYVQGIIKDNTEYPISAGAISVTGEGGRPLLARRFQDRGGEIARSDLFGGAVSALGKVGEIMNQPDSEEEILDESTGRIRTRSSGNQRNITGALMSGFFGQVSQNLSQRNQRATKEITSRPNTWFIPQGTKVTFNVNRSLELP
ncbi:TrbI/VirB10 family protein [Nostoc sp. FACHB-973]|uniref:TrbI/VirB10 family protein n=1 Tax=Desmonostoc muscorum LEGE 12446 TaxID=1828758 RepID=A0A8J7CWA0_DESMC|nr:TrbI/VirB10 family protein [Desmonostoc muscorum]MBD2517034.1 TrbI/VirB10 family protein [Nostoc sp. FACHB-973]MCF2152198.1 TrbI/VirB10 family protein [Desmonostoc muscorum LEGE 12446]